ncbi:MAG: Ni/Fe-hydrogenase cytochrome b subunit, partial [bacterium]
KVGDVLVRGAWQEMVSVDGALWVTELMLGVVLPLVLLLNGRVRRSAVGLGSACLMIILGVVLNRLNVFMLAYHPPFAEKAYIPSLIEFGLSIGLVAALMLVYRVAVAYLPILEPRPARPEA